jgi:hypothetical protein
MNKLIKAICLSIVLSVSVFAQSDSDDDYNKNEYYVGYSNQQVESGNRQTFHGFEGAYTRNVSRYFGIRGTISGAYNNRVLQGILFDPILGNYTFQQETKRSVHQFLGGVQIKDNASKARFKPFGFALGGIAVRRSQFKNLACTSPNCPTTIPIFSNATFTTTNFSAAFGGGLDIKINDKIDFRAIQVDYNPIFTGGQVLNNFRFGVGIVFK